jgi:hypothetical protein
MKKGEKIVEKGDKQIKKMELVFVECQKNSYRKMEEIPQGNVKKEELEFLE